MRDVAAVSLTAAEEDNSNADQLTDCNNGSETDVEKSSSGLADHAVAESTSGAIETNEILQVPQAVVRTTLCLLLPPMTWVWQNVGVQ